jgi:hypothetical protein
MAPDRAWSSYSATTADYLSTMAQYSLQRTARALPRSAGEVLRERPRDREPENGRSGSTTGARGSILSAPACAGALCQLRDGAPGDVIAGLLGLAGWPRCAPTAISSPLLGTLSALSACANPVLTRARPYGATGSVCEHRAQSKLSTGPLGPFPRITARGRQSRTQRSRS